MEIGKELLYLSAAEVAACEVGLADVTAAVEAMFAAKAAGKTRMSPKLGMAVSAETVFLNMSGGLGTRPYAGLKWIGVLSADRRRGLPHFTGLLVLNDAVTGVPIMVAEATWITGVRTAAITAVAASYLARPESAGVGFVACGYQARVHLAVLRDRFSIARVRAYGRRRETAAAFVEEARAQGMAAEVANEPRAAVADMDLVITSVPLLPRVAPFLDAAWLAPGSFAAMVDLGYSWLPEGLPALDRVFTDDLDQAVTEKLAYPEPFDGEIAELVAGTRPGRRSPEERTAIVFGGLGLADVAVGALVYERAVEGGIGRLLPL
jgi:ornithine cyclodeaminase/alanine dehydrogenase